MLVGRRAAGCARKRLRGGAGWRLARQQARAWSSVTKKLRKPRVSKRRRAKVDEEEEEEGGLTYKAVEDAYERVQGKIERSACTKSRLFSRMLGHDVYFKKEHFSITGSYKERGALNTLLQLTDEEKEHGVICSSAGNHAQAVSYHSTRLGIDGVIVMPTNTPHVKVSRTKMFGAKVVLHGNSFAEAFEHALSIAEAENRTFIHAFNNEHVTAGQGTVAMELMEQNPYLDAVIVPVGGGGLIAGMALAIKHFNPRIKVYGVEAKSMPGMHNSIKAGRLESVTKVSTMADGIAIENVGAIPFDVIRKQVDDIVLVDEDEIAEAVLALVENERTIVEGSGATGLAALLSGKLKFRPKDRVAVVLTGGNLDMTLLGRIIDKGLVKTGRLARIRVLVDDQPGALATVTTIVSKHGGNIRFVDHERAFLIEHVGYTQPILTIETRGPEHIEEILAALHSEGFHDVSIDTPTGIKKTGRK